MSRMGILAGAAATLLVFAALHVITTMQLRPTEEGGPHYTSVSTSSAPPYISLNVAAINDSLFTSTHQPRYEDTPMWTCELVCIPYSPQ